MTPNNTLDRSKFLPISMEDVHAKGWDEVDIVCVTGDAYVDHPSFGITITARVLEAMGLRVAILAQPRLDTDQDFTRFGRPKLAFFVTSGNIDSMVNNYTVAKRKRTEDAYSPGGKAGVRPDRAIIHYCRKVREIYGDIPLVIGGLEASLRRFAHYDYWDDAVRPSILQDTTADLLIYGMGEHQTRAIGEGLRAGKTPAQLTDIRGICYFAPLDAPLPENAVSCASYDKVKLDKRTYARSYQIQMEEQDAVNGRPIVQKHGDRMLVQTAPAIPLNQQELDEVFALPYQRMYHPVYESQGGVPAIEEVEFSIMHNRGCFGNCNFCAITFHQGRHVTSRSKESVLAEARSFVKNPRFKGYIHDVGGPTANFRGPSCDKQLKYGLCRNRKCLAPKPCPNLKADHSEYIEILREMRAIKGIKKVFIRSGIRYDYLLADKNTNFMDELVRYHISGQLKVAPEHCSNHVLQKMGKPPIEVFDRFCNQFFAATKRAGKEQYLVPYLMSSHPGSTLRDAIELAMYLKKNHIHPEQVQDYYPTPGTPSTCMFYTGLDPATLEPVFVPKTPEEKRLQRALLQYYKPENRRTIIEALQKAGREDLIGPGENCLVTPDREYVAAKREQQQRERILKAAHKPQQGRSAAASRNHLTSNARKDNHIGAKKKKYGPQKH